MPRARTKREPPPHYRVRSDGRAEIRYPLGRGPDGKHRYVYRYPRDVDHAWELYAELELQHARGDLRRPDTLTVGQWLNRWIDSHTHASKSHLREMRRLAGMLTPFIGDRPLQKLTPVEVEEAINRLKASQTRDRYHPRPIAPRTVRMALSLLRSAYDKALALEVVHRNPAHLVKLPRQAREKRARGWEPEAARGFLARNRHRRLYVVYALALGLGLRVGEILALKLSDYVPRSAEGPATLTVQRTATRDEKYRPVVSEYTKTMAGMRRIYLPADVQQVIEEWLVQRAKEAERKGYIANDWLIPASNGALLRYRNVIRDFKEAMLEPRNQEAKGEAPAERKQLFPAVTFHGLRHTFNNLARLAGVPQEVRMAIMGQKQQRVVNDIYVHVYSAELVQAARLMEGMVLPRRGAMHIGAEIGAKGSGREAEIAS